MKNVVALFTKIVLIFLINVCGIINSQNNKKIYVLEFEELEIQKTLLNSKDDKAVDNYNKLIRKADKLLKGNIYSVVNKVGMPPSKDKHDYMSIGPYWWPNPNTENGLPYVRKDGEINPETRNNFTDYLEKDNFISALKTLKYAFYFSNNITYAHRGIELVNAWFLDDSTKMNPNVNYGQYVPGTSEGRCFGIIELRGFIEILKFLELTKDRKVLDKKTEDGMFKWFTEYAYWLQNSKLGKEELTRENNHGTHYDTQLLNILVYLNRIDEVKEYLSTVTKARIFQQIEPDGSQPKELARTKSFSYSVMNLNGFLELAELGQKVGVSLWDVESKDGRSIKKAYLYMLPYLNKEKEWKHQQIVDKTYSEEKLISDLKHAKRVFKDDSFDTVIYAVSKRKSIKY